jgi:hypothetical protein
MLRDYLKNLKNLYPEIQIGYPCFENKLIVRIPEKLKNNQEICHHLSEFLWNNNFTWICDWKNKGIFYLIWKK